ncbi:MAG TPA: glycosyltransferase family 1 protein [Elusimicrobiota bacterium]|nr:glycosyltransferase family 1 protein [Elusimicrobiota bacterium]
MTRPVIVFDARMAYASGIGTYIRGFLSSARELPRSSFELTLLVRSGPPSIPGYNSTVVDSPIYSLSEQWRVPRACRERDAALLHSPHYNASVANIGRSVVTVHDLIHLRFPEFLKSSVAGLYARAFFHHVVPRARAILTVSQHTKQDLIAMLKIPEHKITVAPPGIPPGFRLMHTAEREAVRRTLRLPDRYFLYVGNLKEFKNVPFLLSAYQQFREQSARPPDLLLVGRNFIDGLPERMAAMAGVRWLSEIDQNQLPGIYANAVALVFPSLYEGFGFPPLEAMACGTAVISSDRASLPEVVGDAALLVDPQQEETLVSAMAVLDRDEHLRQALADKGLERSRAFSWSRLVQQTFQVYEQCL